jgi:hypothetical protein
MQTFGLAIAWEWEFDEDFVHGIERECHKRDISTYQILPRNLSDVVKRIEDNDLAFHALYDRASDVDESFLMLVKLLDHESVRAINPHHHVVHAIDKATMHLEFLTHGLLVPTTIILPPYNNVRELHIAQGDVDRLSKPFVIKPANTTGGGTGVVLNARTLEDIAEARKVHAGDKYLLQEFIHPKKLDGRRAWFRVYSVFGENILCWWDDLTHEYTELTEEEEHRFELSGLRQVISTIQAICKLDFFSSEIAVDQHGKFIIVDYVNEICDMRLKSKYHNGAPDVIVHRIEQLIAQEVERHVAKIRMEKV